MKRYRVLITSSAEQAILAHAQFISDEGQAPAAAKRWLERIWNAADRLGSLPRSAVLAEEDRFVDYEVRRVVVGNHLLLFTIDDEQNRVFVIGLRHGHRLPRPEDLPAAPPSAEEEEE